ncbi:MAG: FkbM family methyltransferase, partial [Planctomycetota bacterium]
LSESLIIAEQPSGVYALVNSMGVYDYNNMNLIKLLLKRKPGSVFFDVGANVGTYSVVASEVHEAKVVSLEPHPATYSELKKNIELNKRKNVLMLNLAASDSNGVLRFTNFGNSDSPLNKIVGPDETTNNVLKVEGKTLDQICEDINVVPNIIKIDVEGQEPKVLDGFKKSIHHVRLSNASQA